MHMPTNSKAALSPINPNYNNLTDDTPIIIGALIGPKGGTLAITEPGHPLDGFVLIVPPGALNAYVYITLSEGASTEMVASSPSVRLKPHGLKFNHPVRIELARYRVAPLMTDDTTCENDLGLFCLDPGCDTWVQKKHVRIDQHRKVYITEIMHF
jgi:hypothetical protein